MHSTEADQVSKVFGRAEAFTIATIFYIVGFIIVATCTGIAGYAAGACIVSVLFF